MTGPRKPLADDIRAHWRRVADELRRIKEIEAELQAARRVHAAAEQDLCRLIEPNTRVVVGGVLLTHLESRGQSRIRFERVMVAGKGDAGA